MKGLGNSSAHHRQEHRALSDRIDLSIYPSIHPSILLKYHLYRKVVLRPLALRAARLKRGLSVGVTLARQTSNMSELSERFKFDRNK
jgi:hypothetical protein